jgi:hypothetical protein
MSEWPKYESHKIVQAAKIVNQQRDAEGEVVSVEVILPDGDKEWFQATVPAMTAKANIGDWAMLYPDGFKSISPAKAFEQGYTLCP